MDFLRDHQHYYIRLTKASAKQEGAETMKIYLAGAWDMPGYSQLYICADTTTDLLGCLQQVIAYNC